MNFVGLWGNRRTFVKSRKPNGVLFFLLVRDHDDLMKSVFGRNAASLRLTPHWSERRTDKLAKCCIILKTFLIPIIVKFDLLFFISMLGVTTLNFVFHQKHGLVTLKNL